MSVAYPLQTFVTGSLLAGIIGLVFATLLLPNAWPAFRHWRVARLPELRRAAGYAFLSLSAAGPSEIDKSLAARLLPLAAAGVYSGAARIISAVALPVNAMVHAVLPTLFHEARTKDGIPRMMIATMFGAAFLYGCLAAFAMWALAPVIVWLFGDAYVGIGPAVSVLCVAIPGITLRLTGGAVLMARNQPWARLSFEVTGIAVLVLAAIFFAPRFGTFGMIVAYVAAEWTMAFVATAIVTGKFARNG
jgi:O-antigen/teichoic acid export membrane protein